MCYNPLHIKTNTLHFNIQRFVNTVPCGQCEECQRQRIKDYKKRMYYEYERCEKLGGFSLMVTLTYKEKYLPRVKFKGLSLPTFLKSDIQKFIIYFRRAIIKTFPDELWLYKEPFRYIQVCEYGDTYGRPHYHLLFHFFLPCENEIVMVQQLKGLIYDSWRRRIKLNKPLKKRYSYIYNGKVKRVYKTFNYIKPNLGRVDISFYEKTNHYFVQNSFALSYVADYMHKDYNFFDTHNQLIDSLEADDKKLFLLNNGPFHFNSLSYGDISNDLTLEDIKTNTHKVIFHGYPSTSSLPLYLQRKCYYKLHKDKTYHLNENGLKYKFSTLASQRANFRQNVALALGCLQSGLPSNLVTFSNGEFNNSLPYYVTYLESTCANYGLDFVTNYFLLFHKRYLSPYLLDIINNDSNYPIDVCFSDSESDKLYAKLLEFDSNYDNNTDIFKDYVLDDVSYNPSNKHLLLHNYSQINLPELDTFIEYLNKLLSLIHYYDETCAKNDYYYKHNVIPKLKQK